MIRLNVESQLQYCIIPHEASLQPAVASTLLIIRCHSHQGAGQLSSNNPAAWVNVQTVLFSMLSLWTMSARQYLIRALSDVLQAEGKCVGPFLHICAWCGLRLNFNCLHCPVSGACTGKHQGGCTLNSRRNLRPAANLRQAARNIPDTVRSYHLQKSKCTRASSF